MKKFLNFFVFFLVIYLSSSREVLAKLVTIDKDGEVIVSVLAENTSLLQKKYPSYFEVKKVVRQEAEKESFVSLEKSGDTVNLIVFSDNQRRDLEIKGSVNDLVEVEERPQIQRVLVGVKDGMFTLEQGEVTALTELPVRIDAKRAIFSMTSPRGDEFLSILPLEAVEFALRTRLINKVSKDKVEITQGESELQYKISGARVFKLADIFEYSIPITIYVSAQTGEILSVDSPTWFRFVRFLFV